MFKGLNYSLRVGRFVSWGIVLFGYITVHSRRVDESCNVCLFDWCFKVNISLTRAPALYDGMEPGRAVRVFD